MNTKTNNNITFFPPPPPRTYSHYLKIFFASFLTFNLFLFNISCNDGAPLTRENSDYTTELNNTQNADNDLDDPYYMNEENDALIDKVLARQLGNTQSYNAVSSSTPVCKKNECYNYDPDKEHGYASISFSQKLPPSSRASRMNAGFVIRWPSKEDSVCKCNLLFSRLHLEIKYNDGHLRSAGAFFLDGYVNIRGNAISFFDDRLAHDGKFENALQEAAKNDPDSVELIFGVHKKGLKYPFTFVIDNKTTRLLAKHAKYRFLAKHPEYSPYMRGAFSDSDRASLHVPMYESFGSPIKDPEDIKRIATFGQNLIKLAEFGTP